MKILSVIGETSGRVEYGKSGVLGEIAKQLYHWLRRFMMVPFVVLGGILVYPLPDLPDI